MLPIAASIFIIAVIRPTSRQYLFELVEVLLNDIARLLIS